MTPQTENELPEWEKRFDEDFPAFTGVGAPYPIFDPPNPNRSWIKQFIAKELAHAEEEKAQAVEAERERIFNETAQLRIMYGRKENMPAYKLVNDTIKEMWLVLGARQNRNGDFELSPQPQTEREEVSKAVKNSIGKFGKTYKRLGEE